MSATIKKHNKSVMFARKNTDAGAGLRAAPVDPYTGVNKIASWS